VPAASLETHDFGITWVMREAYTRTSHALVHEGRVWLIDPVDEPDALAAVAERGEPAAVLQLLDRHGRDCAAIARRLDVPHLELPRTLADSPLQPFSLVNWPHWKEVSLWWPEHQLLVVAEAVGTNPLFTVDAGPVGVHPILRLWPPRALGRYQPEHLLVGHGKPRHGAPTADELSVALARSRRDIPRLIAALPRMSARR
jgi:hypothetical protein